MPAMLPVVDPHVRLGGSNDASGPDDTGGSDGTGGSDDDERLATLRPLLDDTGGCHVLRAVHVQEDLAWDDALADVARVQRLARTRGSGGLPSGIVACCDPSGGDGDGRLATLARHPNLRAVRVPASAAPPPDLFALERHGLALEIRRGDHPLEAIVRLARARPGCRIVLDDAGPADGGDAAIAAWREDLRRLSSFGNAFVKLRHAGLVRNGHASRSAGTADDVADGEADARLRRLIGDALDAVGPERLVLASGFDTETRDDPVGAHPAATVHAAWHAFSRATTGLASRRRDALFRSNAVRAYRL